METKLNAAVLWLNDHPSCWFKTGRDLEQIVLPYFGTATYKTWNKAKQIAIQATLADELVVEFRHTVVIDFKAGTITYVGDTTRMVHQRSEAALKKRIQMLQHFGYTKTNVTRGVLIFRKEASERGIAA